MQRSDGLSYVRKKGFSVGNLVNYIILTILSICFIVPVALVYVISFTDEKSIEDRGYTLFPEKWSLEGYRYLLTSSDQLMHSSFVSVFITVVGTILAVIVTGMLAYVLYRKDFKCRKGITFYIFFTMLFSGGMVPSYIINTQLLHLGDTLWILFLPCLCGGWNVIVLRTFMTQAIPDSLVEAAHIDGAGEGTTFFKVVLPLATPGLATIGLFTMIGLWNDWFAGLLYINNPDLLPLQVMLEKIESNLDYLKQNATLAASAAGVTQALQTPSDSVRMALAVIIMTPIIFAYPFFQRYFIQGLTIGSVKG